MKTFTVYTFANRPLGRRLRKSHISAYTLWVSPEWPGCVEYTVEAETGEEAKREARLLRLADELAKEAPADEDEQDEAEA